METNCEQLLNVENLPSPNCDYSICSLKYQSNDSKSTKFHYFIYGGRKCSKSFCKKKSKYDVPCNKLYYYNVYQKKFILLSENFNDDCGKFGTSMIYREKTNELIVFGGKNKPKPKKGSKWVNTLYSYPIKDSKWVKLDFENPPVKMDGHSVLYRRKTDSMILFGGWHSKGLNSDIYECSFERKKWSKVNISENSEKPRGRNHHQCHWLSNEENEFFIFGQIKKPDFWIFNFETLSWSEKETYGDVPEKSFRRYSSIVVANKFFICGKGYIYVLCLSSYIWKKYVVEGFSDIYMFKMGYYYEGKKNLKLFTFGGCDRERDSVNDFYEIEVIENDIRLKNYLLETENIEYYERFKKMNIQYESIPSLIKESNVLSSLIPVESSRRSFINHCKNTFVENETFVLKDSCLL